MPSHLERELLNQMIALSVPMPEQEYRFAAIEVGMQRGVRKRLVLAGLRDWRFDFAWPALRFAVEVEGGNYKDGRHTRGKGFEEDCQKYHHAMRLGWAVYRCDGRLVKTWDAADLISNIVTGASHRKQ